MGAKVKGDACPACERYIGTAGTCPYCEVDSPMSAGQRALWLAAWVLGIGGLVLLAVAAWLVRGCS